MVLMLVLWACEVGYSRYVRHRVDPHRGADYSLKSEGEGSEQGVRGSQEVSLVNEPPIVFDGCPRSHNVKPTEQTRMCM